MTEPSNTANFGYRKVPWAERQSRVNDVFHSVASRYDLMNDLMSLGSHRLIKRFALELSAARPGQTVLDLAGGTGDMAMRLSPLVGAAGRVVLADINGEMLEVARDRIIDRGLAGNIDIVRLNGEELPFAAASFDCVCIAYGLRNITDQPKALASMLRVLKPGGRALILEFSRVNNPLLSRAYDAWSALWPPAGKLVTGDSESYRYLVESIRVHHDQDTLLGMLQSAGFEQCRFHNVMDGICAVHVGLKPAAAPT